MANDKKDIKNADKEKVEIKTASAEKKAPAKKTSGTASAAKKPTKASAAAKKASEGTAQAKKPTAKKPSEKKEAAKKTAVKSSDTKKTAAKTPQKSKTSAVEAEKKPAVKSPTKPAAKASVSDKEKAAAAEKAKKEKEAAKAKEKAAKEKAAAAEKAKKEKEAAKAKEKAAKEKAAAAEKAKREKEAAKAKEKAAKEKAAAAEKAKKEKEAAKAKEKAAKEKAAAAEKAKKEKEAVKAKEKAAKEKAAAAEKAKKEKEAVKAKEKAAKEKAAAAEKAKKEKESAKAKEKAAKEKPAISETIDKGKKAPEKTKEEKTAAADPLQGKNSEGKNTKPVKPPKEKEKKNAPSQDEELTESEKESLEKISVISDDSGEALTKDEATASVLPPVKEKKPSLSEKLKSLKGKGVDIAPIKEKLIAYKRDIAEEHKLRAKMHENVRILRQKELTLAKKLEAEREEREGIDRAYARKKKLIGFSAAALCFVILYLFVISPMGVKNLHNIPVYYHNLAVGMSISQPVETVNISVKGPRLKVFGLSGHDLFATVDMSQTSAYGKYEAVIHINGLPEGTYVIDQSCAVYSADVVQSQNAEYKIEFVAEGSLANNSIVLETIPSFDKAAVFGSEAELGKVKSVKGMLKLHNKSGNFSEEVTLGAYDAEGNILSEVHVSPASVTCDVIVGTTKDVKVNIVTTGDSPKRYIFDGAVSSVETVTVAGTKKALKALTSVDTVPIKLASYTQTTTLNTALEFPDGIYPYNGVSTVEATVSVVPMTIATYTLSEVEIVSLGKGLEIDTSSIPTAIMVTFGGREADMAEFSQDDVRLYINVEDKKEGSYRMPVLYNIPDPIYVVNTNAETVPVKIYKTEGN